MIPVLDLLSLPSHKMLLEVVSRFDSVLYIWVSVQSHDIPRFPRLYDVTDDFIEDKQFLFPLFVSFSTVRSVSSSVRCLSTLALCFLGGQLL